MYQSCIVFFIMIMMGPIVFAQKDQKADSLMVSLISYYQAFDDISVDFSYQEQMRDSDSLNNEMMGSLFMKDSLFVVRIPNLEMRSDGIDIASSDKDIDGVPDLEMRSDGIDIYTITSENQEVYRSPISESEQIPFHLLTLLTFLQNNFEAQLDITEYRFDRKIHFIKLTPLDIIDSIESVLLGIDHNTHELSSLIIENTDSINASMSFEDYVYNQGLDYDFFVFNPNDYPDYIIIE